MIWFSRVSHQNSPNSRVSLSLSLGVKQRKSDHAEPVVLAADARRVHPVSHRNSKKTKLKKRLSSIFLIIHLSISYSLYYEKTPPYYFCLFTPCVLWLYEQELWQSDSLSREESSRYVWRFLVSTLCFSEKNVWEISEGYAIFWMCCWLWAGKRM